MPTPPCHVVAVPYPGRGHINAMVNLCRLLAARGDGVTATVVVTEEWLGLLGGPAALPAALGPRVRFEATPNVVPSEHGRAGDMVGFVDAVYTRMEAPFERLLDRLAAASAPPRAPAAIVADVFVPWAVAVGARRGVPVCMLCPLSATMFAVQYNFHRLPPAAVDGGGGGSTSPVTKIADVTDPCLVENYIPGTKSIRLSDLAPTNTNKTMRAKILEAYSALRKAQCVLFTSFYELESDAIAALRHELPCPVYAVGPCIPFMALQVQEHHAPCIPFMALQVQEHHAPCIPFMALQVQEHHADEEKLGYTAWLDSQPAGSVLYVSLGSFLSVSSAQLNEIAAGLAESKARFLWALRDAGARSHVRGLIGGHHAGVVVPWTDQLRVLCHRSVGGFFTHCGMNSALEAVYAGVPMLTLPIAFDQPVNSRLAVEVWETGLGLREKARAADGVVGREEVAAAVDRLMRRDTAEAQDRLRKAALLKDAARAACEEGGSSWNDVTSFLEFISE